MNKDFYKNRIKKAKPILEFILSEDCDREMTENVLYDCDTSIVATIRLLMYMGRDAQYERRKKVYKKPMKWFMEWAEYMGTYKDKTGKEILIKVILGKKHHKAYISNALRLMSIKL